MKQLIILILCNILVFGSSAQNDSTAVKESKKNIAVAVEPNNKTKLEIGESTNGQTIEVITDEWGDTTHIKIGDQTYKVIEGKITTANSGDANNSKTKNSAKVTGETEYEKDGLFYSEDGETAHITIGNSGSSKTIEVHTNERGDTTQIRVGRRNFKVIEGNNRAYLKYEKEVRTTKWRHSMNTHWAGLEVGLNMFENTDYSIYNGTKYQQYGDVFDLRLGKSLSWNLNFMEFAFKNKLKTFALVTGMGISFNDYTFDLPVTLEKENGYGITVPVSIRKEDKSVKKTKLHVNYLTVPLMFEIKTPLKMNGSHLSLSAGAIGGLYIGSHTKYKYHGKEKVKIKGNYNINQWKYDLTGRIHFGDFTIFANYSMTSLFETNQGPKIHPLMIGIAFPNI